jgi:hypothetical protein
VIVHVVAYPNPARLARWKTELRARRCAINEHRHALFTRYVKIFIGDAKIEVWVKVRIVSVQVLSDFS